MIEATLQEFRSWVGKELFGIEKFNSIDEVTDRVLYDLVSGTDLGAVPAEGVRMINKHRSALRLSARPKRMALGSKHRMELIQISRPSNG